MKLDSGDALALLRFLQEATTYLVRRRRTRSSAQFESAAEERKPERNTKNLAADETSVLQRKVETAKWGTKEPGGGGLFRNAMPARLPAG